MASFIRGNTEIDYSLSGRIRFVRLEGDLLLSDDYAAANWKQRLWDFAEEMGLTEYDRGWRAWVISLADDLGKELA